MKNFAHRPSIFHRSNFDGRYHTHANASSLSASHLCDKREMKIQRSTPYDPPPAGSRLACWSTLGSDDRQVFKTWALRVAAFYFLVIASLVASIVLGNHHWDDLSPTMQHEGPPLPAKTVSTGK